MNNITKFKFDSREKLFDKLTADVTHDLAAGILKRGAASMLLSGGTTPGPLYEKLSRADLEWENIYFAPTDERWVEPGHRDSNERLMRETLLQGKAALAHYIGLKSSAADPVSGQVETEKNLKILPMPLDTVLLGMGEDGHVASLFPGLDDTKKALEDDSNLCGPIIRGDGDTPRMTMTLRCLLQSKRIYLLFFGEKKLNVFEKALENKSDQLPVSEILHQNKVPVSLYWAL